MDEDMTNVRRRDSQSRLAKGSSLRQLLDAIKANVQQEITPNKSSGSVQSTPAAAVKERSADDARLCQSEGTAATRRKQAMSSPSIQHRAISFGDAIMSTVQSNVQPLHKEIDDEKTPSIPSTPAIPVSSLRRSVSEDAGTRRQRSKSEDVEAVMYRSQSNAYSPAIRRRSTLSINEDISLPSSILDEFSRLDIHGNFQAEERADPSSHPQDKKTNSSTRQTRRGGALAERKVELLEQIVAADCEIEEMVNRRNKLLQAVNNINKSLARASTMEGNDNLPDDVYVPPRKLKTLPASQDIGRSADSKREKDVHTSASSWGRKVVPETDSRLHHWESIEIDSQKSGRSEVDLPEKKQVHPQSA